jgi:hypothetical protein
VYWKPIQPLIKDIVIDIKRIISRDTTSVYTERRHVSYNGYNNDSNGNNGNINKSLSDRVTEIVSKDYQNSLNNQTSRKADDPRRHLLELRRNAALKCFLQLPLLYSKIFDDDDGVGGAATTLNRDDTLDTVRSLFRVTSPFVRLTPENIQKPFKLGLSMGIATIFLSSDALYEFTDGWAFLVGINVATLWNPNPNGASWHEVGLRMWSNFIALSFAVLVVDFFEVQDQKHLVAFMVPWTMFTLLCFSDPFVRTNAAFTTSFVFFSDKNSTPDGATQYFVGRIETLLVGILINVAIEILFWPISPSARCTNLSVSQFDNYAEYLQKASAHLDGVRISTYSQDGGASYERTLSELSLALKKIQNVTGQVNKLLFPASTEPYIGIIPPRFDSKGHATINEQEKTLNSHFDLLKVGLSGLQNIDHDVDSCLIKRREFTRSFLQSWFARISESLIKCREQLSKDWRVKTGSEFMNVLKPFRELRSMEEKLVKDTSEHFNKRWSMAIRRATHLGAGNRNSIISPDFKVLASDNVMLNLSLIASNLIHVLHELREIALQWEMILCRQIGFMDVWKREEDYFSYTGAWGAAAASGA